MSFQGIWKGDCKTGSWSITGVYKYRTKGYQIRKGKMYIDFLQNRPQATVAGPYSLRPKPFAPVSMPLHWEEIKPGLQIKNFNLKNAISRIKEQGDLFSGVLGEGIDLEKAIQNIESMFGGG